MIRLTQLEAEDQETIVDKNKARKIPSLILIFKNLLYLHRALDFYDNS